MWWLAGWGVNVAPAATASLAQATVHAVDRARAASPSSTAKAPVVWVVADDASNMDGDLEDSQNRGPIWGAGGDIFLYFLTQFGFRSQIGHGWEIA